VSERLIRLTLPGVGENGTRNRACRKDNYEDSIVALASSVEPIETSPKTLAKIQKKIEGDQGGFLGRLRRWFSKT